MIPDEELARSRFATLARLRAGGVVVMIVGLIVWHSDLLVRGGHPKLGVALFLAGVLLSLVLPPYLVRRWRTPPRP